MNKLSLRSLLIFVVASSVSVFAERPGTNDTYMVIDLSAGASATDYPVSYLTGLPDPIPDTYKTTHLVFRRIPKGIFMMGAPTNEAGYWGETQHEVTLTEDFYAGVFEVTQKQWVLVMGNNPSAHTGDRRPVEDIEYRMIRGDTLGAGWPESDAVDAGSFLGVLRSRAGLKLDLPTEAQWEYACRAGTTLGYNDQTKNNGAGSDCIKYNSGGVDANLEPLAWYAGNSISDHHHEVGLKQANAWGLYDMTGNVFEWCLDWWQYYTSDAVVDPVGADNSEQRYIRILRGGAHFYDAFQCRSAARYWSQPHNEMPDGATAGGGYVGFRLSYTVPNPDPIGRIAYSASQAGGAGVSWDTTLDQSYTVETNASLLHPNWGIYETVTGTGGRASVFAPVDQATLFYKVSSDR
ncbi:Serine/threonine-protein kinase pkn1 [Pontiella desulfatans]|uniref:Serine/threonine-protein kinase pkn1 n=1 Tax=Pontiella desulfatans TaxID=2750659 RepID=A0A6C2UAD4_PONDE|nr:formylglycine-generating enzyme family protein [Pontiella desulfatans]VGO16336.1 Serine/threonine-protein kinase pkn1 [Pontiella desulfatans]